MATKQKSKSQLEKSINNAVVFVPKDKETMSIFFSDKGLRLTTTEDRVVIETTWHRHVYENITSAGVSRPFLYTRRVIELAMSNDCCTEDGYSFAKLLEVLKEKDENNYNMVVYYEWWITVIHSNLYTIGEDMLSCWLVYFKYVTTLATTSITFSEHKTDMTNKQFVEMFKKEIDTLMDGLDENVVIHALSDEERVKKEVEAMQELEDKLKEKFDGDASKD